MGRNSTRHLCRVPHGWHSDQARCSSSQSSPEQSDQVACMKPVACVSGATWSLTIIPQPAGSCRWPVQSSPTAVSIVTPTALATIPANNCLSTDISGRCITRLELIAIRHPSIFFSVCLPLTSENISFSPVFSWHCALITLRPHGLRNSFAILATLKIFDWHWHWHWQVGCYSRLLPICHWDSWHMGCHGHRAHTGDWQVHHQCHRRDQGDNVLVSTRPWLFKEGMQSPSNTHWHPNEMSLQPFEHCLVFMFTPTGFVLVGQK